MTHRSVSPVSRVAPLALLVAAAGISGTFPVSAAEDYVLTDSFRRPVVSVRYKSFFDLVHGSGTAESSPSFEVIGNSTLSPTGGEDAPVVPPVPHPTLDRDASDPVATAPEATQPAAVEAVTVDTSGNDTYDMGDGPDRVIADDGGYDSILSTVDRDLEAYPEIERLVLKGDGDIAAFGNVKSNRIFGNAGDNLLDGRGGADHLAGGKGDDTYSIESATNDTIVELADEGVDTIVSTSTRDLADYDNIENLTLTFSMHVDGYGTDAANHLVGNAGNNILDGRAGDDVLDGGAGADTLVGGPGKDIFVLSEIGHSRTAAGHRDMVTDLVPGDDRIDISALAPDGGLVFVGEAGFTGSPGEVRWFKRNAEWIILAVDVDGDGTADSEIEVAPVRGLSDSDLVLGR